MAIVNIECSDRVIAMSEKEKEQILELAPGMKVDVLSSIDSLRPVIKKVFAPKTKESE